LAVQACSQDGSGPTEEQYVPEPVSIELKINSYLISRKQNSGRFSGARLSVSDETQTWEITLFKKDGSDPDKIKLEGFEFYNKSVQNQGVFRSITIIEGEKVSGSDLFAYMPEFKKDTIQIDLCDKRTEGVRRRLILKI
jgi:hypothetical protein